jgi:hypothetical protein
MSLRSVVAAVLMALVAAMAFGAPAGAETPAQPCSPSIMSVSPPSAAFWFTDIAVEGTCFGSTGTVTFGGEQLDVKDWSDQRIVANFSVSSDKAGTGDLVVTNDSGMTARVAYALHNYILPDIYIRPGTSYELVPGVIAIKVRPGADVEAVFLRHGGVSPEPVFPGPYDPVLSRWWKVSVPAGHEMEKVIEFAADPDVEWAEPYVKDAFQLFPALVPSPALPVRGLPAGGGAVRPGAEASIEQTVALVSIGAILAACSLIVLLVARRWRLPKS